MGRQHVVIGSHDADIWRVDKTNSLLVAGFTGSKTMSHVAAGKFVPRRLSIGVSVDQSQVGVPERLASFSDATRDSIYDIVHFFNPGLWPPRRTIAVRNTTKISVAIAPPDNARSYSQSKGNTRT